MDFTYRLMANPPAKSMSTSRITSPKQPPQPIHSHRFLAMGNLLELAAVVFDGRPDLRLCPARFSIPGLPGRTKTLDEARLISSRNPSFLEE